MQMRTKVCKSEDVLLYFQKDRRSLQSHLNDLVGSLGSVPKSCMAV